MRFVPRFSRLLPPFLWRPAVFLAAIAQLAVGLAPLAEMREGLSASAHVESRGVALHHAHDESTCIVSIAQTLLASAVPETRGDGNSFAMQADVAFAAPEIDGSFFRATTHSRAPPESGLIG